MPSTLPPLASFGTELYGDLWPLAWLDQTNGYALAVMCGAIGTLFEQLRDLGTPDSLGNPGWSLLLDINRCPTAELPYLGQFVGVNVDGTLTDTQQRSQIRNEQGMSRGTPATIASVAAKYLTGAQTVVILERTPDPYQYTVITYTSQTPNPTQVQNALNLANPGGLILTYETVTGQIWAQVVSGYATWAAVESTYPTWQNLIDNVP